MTLNLVPITISDASLLVRRLHRTHSVPQGGLFAVAVAKDGAESPCGVAIVGRPVSRMLDDGWTAEVTRCATDETRNACSMLYRAAWRAAKSLGYRKLVTYTLADECGASLRGAAFTLIGECGGGSWSRENRPRVDKNPQQRKLR